MPQDARLERLLDFLRRSPTPWHATANMAERLEAEGFRRLEETEAWRLSPGERVYVTRNDSSIIALQLPSEPLDALRMIGAHTDSPGLRLKPHAPQTSAGWLQLGVEVYGGALLAPGSIATWAWQDAYTCAMPMVGSKVCCSMSTGRWRSSRAWRYTSIARPTMGRR